MSATPIASSPPIPGLPSQNHPSRKRVGRKLRSRSTPYFFLLPFIVINLVFFLYPLFYATVLAFYQTNGPARRAFVGWNNFAFVLHDPDFHKALWNTTIFAVFSIGLQLPLSLGLAMLLNSKNDRFKGFFRLAIFAPNLVGQVFVGIIFSVLFAPHYGLLNRFLHELVGWGLEQQWLGNPRLVMPAIIIAAMWMYVGFNMIYFLAALQNVDQNLVEAATIDGAGPASIFWNVTVPAIAPVATFVVVTSTIGSYQLFELPYNLLQNNGAGYGPSNSGLTVVGYLYQNAFTNGDLGTGAAVGWILTFIILIISLVQIRLVGSVGSES
ncbi:MAG TPA: sugar ABC transporter permease [Tepidisphaeraceae bacterium]|jgi:ABC-type sugar transport system permease subunit|nr:sugar ABC transporter permease [Tepidisphaeraceae bacterium]